jgi:hypothetical protein
MNWRITPMPPLLVIEPDCAGVSGDQPHQRGLAGAVRSDQRDHAAVASAERDVIEQLTAVRERI